MGGVRETKQRTSQWYPLVGRYKTDWGKACGQRYFTSGKNIWDPEDIKKKKKRGEEQLTTLQVKCTVRKLGQGSRRHKIMGKDVYIRLSKKRQRNSVANMGGGENRS